MESDLYESRERQGISKAEIISSAWDADLGYQGFVLRIARYPNLSRSADLSLDDYESE